MPPPRTDAPRFTFAVISDTHVKLEEGDPSSPYRCNQLAAGRARFVVQQLARLRPRFVVHLGDLVQAVPGFPSHQPAMAEARRLLGALTCDLHVAPGNHDIGDKPVPWAPAPTVGEPHIREFERHWGGAIAPSTRRTATSSS
jgi:metallophosphoesterase superfamily enzyme